MVKHESEDGDTWSIELAVCTALSLVQLCPMLTPCAAPGPSPSVPPAFGLNSTHRLTTQPALSSR